MQSIRIATVKGLFILLLAAAVGPAGAEAPPVLFPIPADLQALIDRGLQENSEIQALQAEIVSLKEEVRFAGSLEVPKLGFGVLNLPMDTFDFDQEPMTQKVVSLSQKFPWFGKLDLKTRQAMLKVARQQALLEAKRLELARRIAEDYFELAFVEQSQEINTRLTEMMDYLLQVTETRYGTGQGLQQDVLQAQVEMSQLLDEDIRLQKMKRTLQDRINAALNQEGFLAIEPQRQGSLEAFHSSAEQLTQLGVRFNPWLKVRSAEIHMAELDVELARKDYWPDMDVRLAYGQRDEDRTGRDLADFLSATVTVNLPLWKGKRQDSKLDAALARQKAADRSHQNLNRRLPHQVNALVTEIERTRQNYNLFRKTLLIQADHWAASSLSAYETNKVEFNTMLTAQLRLLRLEQQALGYRKNILQRQVELAELIGTLLAAGDKK